MRSNNNKNSNPGGEASGSYGRPFTLSEHFFPYRKKKKKKTLRRDGKGDMHTKRASILYFHHWAGKRGASGAAGEGKMTAAGGIVRYKKNFVGVASLQCEGAAAGVAGAAKVARRGHVEGTSRPSFPGCGGPAETARARR